MQVLKCVFGTMVSVEFSVLGHNEISMGWNGISGEYVGSRIRETEYKLYTRYSRDFEEKSHMFFL